MGTPLRVIRPATESTDPRSPHTQPTEVGAPDQAQVFVKYYRAPAAHQQSGSGLGLYIVWELVRRLGGQISYLPSLDAVCFALWLPMRPQSQLTP